MSNVYRLKQEVHFEPRKAWSVQVRSAFAYSEGEPFTAEAGRLVIHLNEEDQEDHLYRFVDGRIGVLDTSPDERFAPVDDPEIVALAEHVRSLPEMLGDYGLGFDTVSRLRPFTLIRCPMCGGTSFTSLDLAGVWCDRCNTSFDTRSTAGDPGVVVDVDLSHYWPLNARYIVPKSLGLSMVIKDFGYSGHPEGPCGERCCNVTDPEPGEARDNGYRLARGIRADVNRCGLQVYDWSMGGYLEPENRGGVHSLSLIIEDGEEEREVDLWDRLYALESVRSNRLPPLEWLDDGDIEEQEWWYLADGLPYVSSERKGWYPVWWKVRARVEQPRMGMKKVVAWEVTDRSLCPKCLRPAGERDHSYCQEKIDWELR